MAFPLYNKYRCIDVLTYISLDCMSAQRERERERERELTDMEREEEGGR